MNSSRAMGSVLVAACLAAASPGLAQITQAERDGFVFAHNYVRAWVAPFAVPPLAAVSYNASFEHEAPPPAPPTDPRGAQEWADRCMYGHSSRPSFGENIYAYASIPDLSSMPPSLPVAVWDSEAGWYNYTANTCTPPPPFSGDCGHYTQLVWRDSVQIGCGIKFCTVNSPFGGFAGGHWFFVVCQYSPQGNVNVATNRPFMCDYDSNGSFESNCTAAPLALYRDSFEIGVERWSGKNPLP